MPLDSLIVGLIVLLICGAACFYLYMRISFIERKGNMMESVIVDLKVAIDSLMSSGFGGGGSPVPISPSPAPQPAPILSAPMPLESSESEHIPEEGFYSSVLEQAHEEVAEAPVTEGTPLDKVLDSFEVVSEPSLDGMSKADLLAEAEKRGLRAKKSSSREQLLGLLRRAGPAANVGMTTGVENVAGGASSLDGTINVDLGQGSSLE
jgi:hypothetical protein